MVAKPTIQILVEKVMAEVGSDKLTAYKALRKYVKKLKEEQFAEEVSRITNRKVFVHLWSVGLSLARQDMCLERMKELVR